METIPFDNSDPRSKAGANAIINLNRQLVNEGKKPILVTVTENSLATKEIKVRTTPCRTFKSDQR